MNAEKPHILLVEDEIHLARGICFNLELEGYRVSHMESGEEALQRLEYDRYSLIILDIMLPGIDGFTVCKKIREMDMTCPDPDICPLRRRRQDYRSLRRGRRLSHEAVQSERIPPPRFKGC